MSPFRFRCAGMIGNLLEHYDRALFGLLAPFIAPLFFSQQDPLTALILTYGMLPLGILSRPLGSLFFGWIGDRFGRRESLYFSLLGMAGVTIAIGCLPTFSQVGYWAPILMALGRMMQNFFDAGESTGGAIFVLEHTPPSKRTFMGSLYDLSSTGGIAMGSGAVALLSYSGAVETGWRFLFWIGGITALLGVYLRVKTPPETPRKRIHQWTGIKEHKKSLLAIVFVSGFSYTTYFIPFVFMNGFIPLISSLSKSEVVQMNTALLGFDLFLLPLFGLLANKWGKERLMIGAAFCSAASAIPLFYCLDNASLVTVIAVRMAIVTLGVAFSAPYHAWALEQVPENHRFTILSLGCTLGSQLIGAPSSALCLWLYQKLDWTFAPGFYLITAALCAGFAVRASLKPVVLEATVQLR